MNIYYTDGSAKDNGSNNSLGGFGIVEIDDNDNSIVWQYQENNIKYATNNMMELSAILYALQHIEINKEKDVIIYSDSAYCVNLINTWMYSWADNNWKRPKNQEVKNLDLIKQIYNLAYLAEIKKVKGHSTDYWNNYVDTLAKGERKI